jgi:hypothetical protein
VGGLNAFVFLEIRAEVFMDGLIHFDDLKAHANASSPEATSSNTFPSAQVIEQLRNRLISPDHRDPVEIKVAILGEIVYFAYRALMKRRTL